MKVEIYDDGIGSVELVDSMGTDLSVVNAARVSFGVKKDVLDEKDLKLIKYMVRNRHTSPFEHCVVTLKFVVPLFVRSQHHRHRTWSFNEKSNRYFDLSSSMSFYLPHALRTQHKSNRQGSNPDDLIDPLYTEPDQWIKGQSCTEVLRDHVEECATIYKRFIDLGVCKEQARMVLPQNLYTEYFGTANLHNVMKFIDLRTHAGSQWEIQRVGSAVSQIVKSLWPVSVSAFEDLILG